MQESRPLLVCHNNRLFAECLAAVLTEQLEFDADILDPASMDFVAQLNLLMPSILLLDVDLPDHLAVTAIRELRARNQNAKVILLMRTGSEEPLLACFQEGAAGCVLEDASLADLKTSIVTVWRGESYCSPQIVHSMFQRLGELSRERTWGRQSSSNELTPRETEILGLIAQQRLSNKQIARQLSLSLYTVKNHVHNILEKLDAEDRYEAASMAQQRHWLG